MTQMRRALTSVLSVLLLSAATLGQTPTQDNKAAPVAPVASTVHTTDDVDILRETQLGVDTKDHTGLVWWIPFEFWVHSAEKNGTAPEKTREHLKALRDYTIVGVFVAKVTAMASFEYVTPAELQQNIVIRDSEGQEYKAATELNGDAKNLADLMRPILANAMGRAGENFAMLFFPGIKKDSKRIADETSKGSFSVVLKNITGEPETTYLWRTPLTSFTAPRYCPVGKERVHADWDYCPRHGVKLDQP